MAKQFIFAFILLVTLVVLSFSLLRIIRYFKLTRPAFPVKDLGQRINVMLNVGFGQTKIFRRPLIGFFHALVFWGFCIILFGSVEMIIEGLSGTEKIFKIFGTFYDIVIASGDVFGLLVTISILIFLIRRLFLHIQRFEGTEMKSNSHIDANIALLLILFLMLSLLGMNMAYIELKKLETEPIVGAYPISKLFSVVLSGMNLNQLQIFYETCWWSHILLIFAFANILPYSKHFHVFMSVPNVFLSRLEPLGKLQTVTEVTREVKLMLDPDAAFSSATEEIPFKRFGIKDAEDISWKNYFDALACTECGRCTSVCPANLTGKKLSPRKIMMDVRTRMKEKGPGLVKFGKDFTDNRSLLRDYITEEELWACTLCHACAQECPININHPTLIVDMRRYLIMEEGCAPGLLKATFNNIENNGAPWQFSPDDRLLWAR